jgi:S-adenosylmethionine-diacylglycerol 3-amino-3-carboxypropyl transferase
MDMGRIRSVYFKHLNYTLANEDTGLELTLAQRTKSRSILTVAGSGGRAWPLLAANPDQLVLVDMAQVQLQLAALRLATIKQFNFRDFCLFWGFPPFRTTENRSARAWLFDQLELDQGTKDTFRAIFVEHDFEGLLYAGRWERSVVQVPRLLRRIVGKSYDEIFSFKDMVSQQAYFDKALSSAVWLTVPRLVLRVFGNAAYFNAFLYKGAFAKKNIAESYYEFFRMAFRRMFAQGLTRENFFLQLCFLGQLEYPEGNPVEAQPDVYAGMQKGLSSCHISMLEGDFFEQAVSCGVRFDFVSLSDVPSYFAGEREVNYLQTLRPCLLPGAIIVSRCYLRIPENTDMTGFTDVSDQYRDLIDGEKMQVYKIFIYRFEGI